MNGNADIREIAIRTIDIEASSIDKLKDLIDESFIDAVKKIFSSKGRVVVTGVGKSANIGYKIVATLNSTGTPAIFMHAADAIHGDLGIVQPDDIVICISKSGFTPEIKQLVPLIKSMGNSLIALVGNTDSYLAKNADYILNTTVEKEACPNNLAPTSSTTAQLVMGDALAVCLLELKKFGSKDFAKYHPGGALGRKLYLTVEDVISSNQKPAVKITDTVNQVILEITTKRMGATAVLNNNNELVGIITDGDIRRMLQSNTDFSELTAQQIMGANPKTIQKSELAIDAYEIIKTNSITQLIVVNNNIYFGMLHLHDLLKEGII